MNLKLKAQDAKKLNAYQHAKFDPLTGLVWIEDGTAGVSHSAHPNVEANKYTRRDRKFVGWVQSGPQRAFLYSPQRFVSTDLDALAASYCQCPGCKPSTI